MPHAPKIATCCYCGTRTALVLRGKDRHELSCASCGAPLHDMKMLRRDAVEARVARPEHYPDRPVRQRKRAPAPDWNRGPRKGYKTRKNRKKRKGLAVRVLEEAFDIIEDIFD
ncbi:hypothetical protein [Marivita sp. GX14005]|uniref:hypothetical protein n=1 Tax=Marivita sp. GX14005 TaxID=2942276 RepID=UPI002018FA63|nr:hypothetical protein [Marivita sp. GX14005]MCL3882346.1 hypothetical protein [Marivita sp. GX14005]